MMLSASSARSMMLSASSTSGSGNGGNTRRYIVFDGSMDFNLWRARLENELLRFHLLGYILVVDYDGSQSFLYNNEEIPPKCGMVVDDDSCDGNEQVQQSDSRIAAADGVLIKDEPSQTSNNFTGRKRTRGALGMRPGRLSRLKVIEERAEAMSILQRHLHPEVERAILGKNIYDSWVTLCGMYGNRNVSDFYTAHRLLHVMKLGEKDESAQDFIARLELMMKQYAQIAGIQLTDPFRSMMLANALPEDWAALLNVWKAFKPYIPYLELVEKVIFEYSSRLVLKERELIIAHGASVVEKEKASTPTLHVPKKTLQLGANSTAEKKSDALVHASTSSKQSSSGSSVCKPATKSVPEKPKTSSGAEDKDKDKHEDKSGSSAKPKADEKKRSEKESSSSYYDKRDGKYDAAKRADKYESSKRADDKNYDKKRDDKREYKRDDQREKEIDDRRDYNKNNSDGHSNEKRNVCYYCLKFGHSFRTCWFLRVDIENDSIVSNHKKYSATVTNERSAYMVYRIEQYAREVRQEKSSSTDGNMIKSPSRSYADQAAMRSKSSFCEEHTFSYSQTNRHHHRHLGGSHDSHILEPPKTPPRSYMSYNEMQGSRMPEPPKTPSQSYSEIASMRSKSMYRECALSPPQQQAYGYNQSTENRLDSDVDRYKKRSRSVYGGDDLDLTMKTRPRDPRSRSVFRQSEESGAHESRSRSTAEHGASRRSVSPIPNNIHRAYNRDSRAY